MNHGRVTPDPLAAAAEVHRNLEAPALLERALRAGEGRLGQGGTLLVETGRFTGRSPQDKHVVRRPATEGQVWWDGNAAMDPRAFERLRADMVAHLAGRSVQVQDLWAGADPALRLGVRAVTERAWHALFLRHLLRRPPAEALPGFAPDWTILNLPSFQADPARHGCRTGTVIALDWDTRQVLIAGTDYAGENKKAVFTVLNWLLPDRGVLPMHCSANHAPGDPDDAAIFFGLSGTGKTTLSSDPSRVLLGDDEHGWSDRGLFNIEGGCYAKTLNLSAQAEPAIHATTAMFGTVIENMGYDAHTRALDFADASRTQNTRCAYPLEAIPNASATGLAGHPRHVVMLTCDAFGVLPPIARLSPEQAMEHFLAGFTAKVAGTERGVTEPTPTFSPCFGAPFLPRRPEVYGRLLARKIARHGAQCWLVNTGWTGGAFGTGTRMPIAATRALLSAALSGGAGPRRLPPRPRLRLRGADRRPGRGPPPPRPPRHLGQPRRLRRAGGAPRGDVPRQGRPLRGGFVGRASARPTAPSRHVVAVEVQHLARARVRSGDASPGRSMIQPSDPSGVPITAERASSSTQRSHSSGTAPPWSRSRPESKPATLSSVVPPGPAKRRTPRRSVPVTTVTRVPRRGEGGVPGKDCAITHSPPGDPALRVVEPDGHAPVAEAHRRLLGRGLLARAGGRAPGRQRIREASHGGGSPGQGGSSAAPHRVTAAKEQEREARMAQPPRTGTPRGSGCRR
jgi:phosphoenolpyruvate carboxykinase (ATP)